MTAGEVFDLNADPGGSSSTSWGDVAAYAGIVLAAVALATVGLLGLGGGLTAPAVAAGAVRVSVPEVVDGSEQSATR
jgi:hypothetical protein